MDKLLSCSSYTLYSPVPDMSLSSKPLEVPPYQVQPLLATVIESYGTAISNAFEVSSNVSSRTQLLFWIGYNTSEDGLPTVEVKCAQALGKIASSVLAFVSLSLLLTNF